MADRDNLYFFSRLLDGIGYGKLSRTNRAYSWIRSNNALGGPCLHFLKENITDANLVTATEMNSFLNVKKRSKIPSKSDIDAELAEFLSDTEIDLQHIHLPSIHNENSTALKFHEVLEVKEKLLKRLSSDFHKELNNLKSQKKQNRQRRDDILVSVAETNTSNEDTFEEVQNELTKITDTYSSVLQDSAMLEERNLLRMNLATFRKINVTFCEVVNAAIREQFRNTEHETIDGRSTIIAPDEASIKFMQNVGLYNYQKLKLRCEVSELEDLKEYVQNISKDLQLKNVDSTRLRFFINEDMVITEQIQKKIKNLTEVLEKFHRDHVVKKMLMAYRKELKRKMKSGSKFLKKISECSTNFVDLMALQACLSQKEKENLNVALAACIFGKQKLKQHREKHSITCSNLQKMSVNQTSRDIPKLTNPRISQSVMSVLEENDPVTFIRDGILSFVRDCLKNYSLLKEQFKELNAIIFCGPTGQVFFYSGLRDDKILIKRKYHHNNKQYKLWKAQYYEIAEKKTVTEFDQLEKSFGLIFLTNAVDLRNKLEQLRATILESRSKSSKTLTTTVTGSDFSKTLTSTVTGPDFSQLVLKKGNISSIIN